MRKTATVSPRREYYQVWYAKNPHGKNPMTRKCLTCGEKFQFAPRRKDTAKFCSKTCLMRTRVGKRAGNWRGGTSTERELWQGSLAHKNWRNAVLERDNYACVLCGSKEGWLQADHIKPWAFFPELRIDIDNGRTLCVPCHKATDTYGAKARKLYQVLTVI